MDCLNCKQAQALIKIKLFLEQFSKALVLLTGYKKTANLYVFLL